MYELKQKNNKILSVCCGGIVNQAVIVNITALLYVAFMQLYQFSFIQMAILTAVGFLSQLCADVILLAIIDKMNKLKMAKLACICSGVGLLFYGCIPLLFNGVGIYIGIVFATIIFAFSGGFLEIILSSIADKINTTFGGVCLLHTVYAWAFAALSLLFLVYYILFGFVNWNYILFVLAIVPLVIFCLLNSIKENIHMPLPTLQYDDVAKKEENAFKKPALIGEEKGKYRVWKLCFYALAFFAVFFGYGAEIIVSQWVSIFASLVLQNDIFSMIGPMFFAICLGIGGIIYMLFLQKKQRISLTFYLLACGAATVFFVLAAVLQIAWLALLFLILSGLFVGILSPSAVTYASKSGLFLGSWLFALLAISQDLSATILPAVFGVVATDSMRLALLLSAPLPLLAGGMLLCLSLYKKRKSLRK